MTSKHAKRAKKKRRMLVEAAIPPEVREETSAKLIQIVEEYFKELLTLPVENYGTHKLDIRREFARRKATALVGKGPAALEDDAVQDILAWLWLWLLRANSQGVCGGDMRVRSKIFLEYSTFWSRW